MILSESEKNRIRTLHREASVIKQPLNEWAAVSAAFSSAKDTLSDYLSGKEGMVPDVLQKKVESVIKKLSPAEQEKVKQGNVESLVDTMMKWVKGESGLLPGDQSKAKAALKKLVMSGVGKTLADVKKGKEGINESTALAKGMKAAMLSGSQGAKVAKESKSAGLPKCGELLMKQANDKQKEKMDSYKDMQSGGGVKKPIPVGGITRVTMNVTLQALAGPVPPSSSGVIALKDGKPFCRVS